MTYIACPESKESSPEDEESHIRQLFPGLQLRGSRQVDILVIRRRWDIRSDSQLSTHHEVI
jgi:hypothetical protein